MTLNQKVKNSGLFLFSILLVSCVIYSFGNFGLLNLFHIKLEVQIALVFLLTSFLILANLIFFKQNIKNILFLFVLYFILSALIVNDIHNAIHMIISLIFVGAILSLNESKIDLVIKAIILFSGIFALLGTIQFIILQFDFDNVRLLDYSFFSGNPYINIESKTSLNYLGFVNWYDGIRLENIFGIEYARSRSFASEPSVLVVIIFIPAILSLLYNKFYRAIGYFVLFYSLFIVYAGVMHLSVIFSVFIFLIAFMFSNKYRIYILYLVIFIVMLIVLVNLPLLFSYLPENKIGSGMARLTFLHDIISSFLSNPFTTIDSKNYPVGIFLSSMRVLPFVGFLMSIILFHKLFKKIFYLLHNNVLFFSLLGGTMFQAFIFSAYGWITLPGFILLALIYTKLNLIYLDIRH